MADLVFGTGQFGVDSFGATPPPPLPSISSVTPSSFVDGETGVTIEGSEFGDNQGTGKVELGSSSDYATATLVTQTVTSWSYASIDFTVVQGGLSSGTVYVFVTNSNGDTTDGFATTLTEPPPPPPAPNETDEYDKRIFWRVYDPDGAYIRTWPDVATALSYSWPINGGPSSTTVELPRDWGEVGEPGDRSALPDLMEGNRVEAWLVDRQAPEGRLQYQGVIDEHIINVTPGGYSVSVTVVPRTAHLADRYIDTLIEYQSADPTVIAEELVSEYLPGTWWEKDFFVIRTQVQFSVENMTLGQALDALVNVAGSGYFYRLSIDFSDNIRFLFDKWDEGASADHDLILGKHVSEVQWRRSQVDKKRRVFVYGATIEDDRGREVRIQAKATEPGYNPDADPRDLVYTNDRIRDGHTALRVATSLLAFHSQHDLSATVTVFDDNIDPVNGYDIETLRPGDTVRIINPEDRHRLPQWDEGQWADGRKWGGTWYQQTQRRVVISGVDYQFDRVVLTLERRPQSFVEDFVNLADRVILGGSA